MYSFLLVLMCAKYQGYAYQSTWRRYVRIFRQISLWHFVVSGWVLSLIFCHTPQSWGSWRVLPLPLGYNSSRAYSISLLQVLLPKLILCLFCDQCSSILIRSISREPPPKPPPLLFPWTIPNSCFKKNPSVWVFLPYIIACKLIFERNGEWLLLLKSRCKNHWTRELTVHLFAFMCSGTGVR